MALGDEYYKEIRIGMMVALAFIGLLILGLFRSVAFLGLNQVNVPSPLSWVLTALLGYTAYQIKMNY